MPQEDYLLEKYNKRYTAYSPGKKFFTVFRVGDKFKVGTCGINIDSKPGEKIDTLKDAIKSTGLSRFEKHNNREIEVENADPQKLKYNQVLIGDKNVSENVENYIKGIKLRDNAVIAREILLSGGNGFWDRLTPQDRQLWIDTNFKFLKDNFGDNCIYACLHMDETTPHIHALIVSKFWNEKKRVYELRSNVYFDGPKKLAEWQDKYTKAITDKFNCFMRGIRGSKATHVDLKTYYALIKENLNERQSKSILAYAKENFLNKKKVEELQETLTENNATMEACNKIIENNKKLKKSNELYQHTIRQLAKKYNIPETEVLKILENEKKKSNSKSTQRER